MATGVARSVPELRAQVHSWRQEGLQIGFVPTMGALHPGHISLVRAALAACDRVVASIFVNPTQFGVGEDYERYPRNEAADLAALDAAGCHLLYAPGVADMYPEGFATSVTVAGLTEGLCGAVRPGHFAGVATVVAKLLNQVQADAAFFGEKDYQQLLTIRRMATDLDLPVEIVGVPTLREPDGLAMSSRNAYLAADERRIAAVFPAVLAAAVEQLAGEAAAPVLARTRTALEAAGFSVDYVELRDASTLVPVGRVDADARLLGAVRIGRTRLIDNMAVPARSPAGPGAH
jgi:pantoate--beta-alanine ligase